MEKHILKLIIIIGILGSFKSYSQSGCTDPLAENFNPNAVINDGSCLYQPTMIVPITKIESLPEGLQETSGLLWVGSNLWTFNDSGNQPRLFAFDTISGAVFKQVDISNTGNIDWEAITMDENWIYIGDFGNNDGTRRNLRVLRFPKIGLPAGQFASRTVTIHPFTYEDQTNFSSSNRHDFDCEAFVMFNDTLHLFTKNRGNHQTHHYTIAPTNNQPSNTAKRKTAFNIDGLVTDASLSPDGRTLALITYDNRSVNTALWLFSNWPVGTSNFFEGNKRKIELPSALIVGQIEGLAWRDDFTLWLSNEKTPLTPARLYQINLLPMLTGGDKKQVLSLPFVITQTDKEVEITTNTNVQISFRLITTDGKIIEKGTLSSNSALQLQSLSSGNNKQMILQLIADKYAKTIPINGRKILITNK